MPNDECAGRGVQNLSEKRLEPERIAIASRCGRFSLSAFCGVGGAKWGEGRGEVPGFTNSLARNPKFKIRNPKEIRSPKSESEGWREISPALLHNSGKLISDFGFRSSFGFRGFGFRISDLVIMVSSFVIF